MPKAEVGSTKWQANKMKAKGLQRLRWYCQVCERQMRDANGFKQHTLSEGHVRQMQVIGSNANRVIADYSQQFKHDFLLLLRTSHGEKKISINKFYQEYIANKEHVHMNATKWTSLTEFAKFLGREGICRVEEGERGLDIAWIDNSPEALRRQDALRKRERLEKGDEERERRLIEEQVERAREQADEAGGGEDYGQGKEAGGLLERTDGEKISLSFGKVNGGGDTGVVGVAGDAGSGDAQGDAAAGQGGDAKVSLSMSKPKNVFAVAAKKNALAGNKAGVRMEVKKPVSEAERIMKEELARKRARESDGRDAKRVRL